MSRTISLIVLALVTAAVAVPVASAGTTPTTCSQADNPSSCYQGKPFVDPLAISYLGQMGLSPAQIRDWTTGVCAQRKRPAVCYAPFDRAERATATVTPSSSFEWGDAGIGAAATLGAVLLLGGFGAIVLTTRHSRQRTVANA